MAPRSVSCSHWRLRWIADFCSNSVDEFVFMTEKGYNKEEIIKGERIILQVRRDVPSGRFDEIDERIAVTRIQHFSLLLAVFLGSTNQQG